MAVLEKLLDVIPQVDSVLILLALIVVVLLLSLLFVLNKPDGVQALTRSIIGDKMPSQDIAPLIKTAMYLVAGLLAMSLAVLLYKIHIVIPEEGSPRLCQDETCWNRDPNDNRCNLDAQTLISTITRYPEFGEKYDGAPLEMRHSKFCNSSWVKGLAPIGFRAYVRTESGEEFGNTIKVDDGFYTDMGPGEGMRQVCVEKPDGSDPQCTSLIE